MDPLFAWKAMVGASKEMAGALKEMFGASEVNIDVWVVMTLSRCPRRHIDFSLAIPHKEVLTLSWV
jgi:hypothetical protein